MKLILKLLAPYACPSFPSTCGVSRLHHKVLDVAMDEDVIVISTGTEGKEILK